MLSFAIAIKIDVLAESSVHIFKQYSDTCNESHIILKPNKRFFAELYFDDDEGGGYSGFWWVKKDTLFLLSDKIECDLYDIMKIKKAELLKFQFIIKDSLLLFSQLEEFSNNKFTHVQYNNIIDKRFAEIDGLVKFNKTRLSIESDFFEKLKNSFWASNDNKIMVKIQNDLSIEYFEFPSKTIRYGYVAKNSPSDTNVVLLLDNIVLSNYDDLLSIKNVQFDKISLNQGDGYFIIMNYNYVKCIIGSESDYFDWYDFENSDYIETINSKIIKIDDRCGKKLFSISEDDFNSYLLKNHFKY